MQLVSCVTGQGDLYSRGDMAVIDGGRLLAMWQD